MPLVTFTATICCFKAAATTEIYTLSLHDALPILNIAGGPGGITVNSGGILQKSVATGVTDINGPWLLNNNGTVSVLTGTIRDRKSTRLNSSHEWTSYADFCLKKRTKTITGGVSGA